MKYLSTLKEHSVNHHYYNRYCAFIQSLCGQTCIGYTEEHHMHPLSFGGDDASENIITLSARQHFLAHWMLWKACGRQMTGAFWNMRNCKGNKVCSRVYQKLKEARSEDLKSRMRIYNLSTDTELMHYRDQPIPEGFVKGRRPVSEETKKKQSERMKGEGNHFYGKTHTDVVREKLREASTGVVQSEETRKKQSEANKGRVVSDETKAIISDQKKGENNPFYGKKHNEASLDKIRESSKGSIHIYHPATMELRNLRKDSEIPKGWIKGRPPTSDLIKEKMSRANKGRMWIYHADTLETRMIKDEPIPDGWLKGRPKKRDIKKGS